MTLPTPYLRIVSALIVCAVLFGCIRQEQVFLGNIAVTFDANGAPPITPVLEVAPEETPPQTQAQNIAPPEQTTEDPRNDSPQKKQPSRAATSRSMFNSRDVRHDNIDMFPRWTGMLARYNAESHKLDDICGAEQYSPCKLKEWKDFLESLREEPLQKQMDAINRFINKYPYIDDIVNWGFDNYWETPYEFQLKSGNCKDYAIAKFMSLRALNVSNDIMRIEVVKDLNLGGIIHAVLVVSVEEKPYILDNQIKQVVPANKIYHYMPIYSINEKNWWRHFAQQ